MSSFFSETVRELLFAGRVDEACEHFAREHPVSPADARERPPTMENLIDLFDCSYCDGRAQRSGCNCGDDGCDGMMPCRECEGLGLGMVDRVIAQEAFEMSKKVPGGTVELRRLVLRAAAHGRIRPDDVTRVASITLGMV